MILPFFFGIVADITIAALVPIEGTAPIIVSIGHTVHCAEGRSFEVQLAPDRAIVFAEGKRWTLARMPPHLFVRYTSKDGALAIDVDIVALVLTGDLGFTGYHVPR